MCTIHLLGWCLEAMLHFVFLVDKFDSCEYEVHGT